MPWGRVGASDGRRQAPGAVPEVQLHLGRRATPVHGISAAARPQAQPLCDPFIQEAAASCFASS